MYFSTVLVVTMEPTHSLHGSKGAKTGLCHHSVIVPFHLLTFHMAFHQKTMECLCALGIMEASSELHKTT